MTTVQILTRIVRAVQWSRVSVKTAALQTNRAELGRATATTTTTVEKVSSAGEAIAPSLDQTTLQKPIVVTTQNILTWGKVIRIVIYHSDHNSVLQLLAGTMVASAKTEKRSRRRISATTDN